MAYHVEPSKPIAEEVRRVLKEEIETAAKQLSSAGGIEDDDAIHEARKSVKKIRAVLRLVKTEHREVYRKESKRFRDIGRTLSALRDAGAMMETFDGLRKHYGAEVDRRTWDSLRRLLRKQKQQREQAVDAGQVFRTYPGELEAIAKELDSWPMHGRGFAWIAPGFKKAYRRGREALAVAERDPRSENFHEWRKRVKDHWYHARLLEPAWNDMLKAYGDVLKNIQSWLGDDHNLTVLRDVIAQAEIDGRGVKGAEKLLTVMERHQTQLREQAFTAGVRVYFRKPTQVLKEMEFLWRAPAEKPETVEAF